MLWTKFNTLVASEHKPMPLSPSLIFHAIQPDNTLLPRGLIALHMILWKFTIYNLVQVDTDNIRFSTHKVWSDTIRRFETRASALAFKVKRRTTKRHGQGIEITEPDAENRMLAPLATVTPWGKLEYSPAMQKVIESIHTTSQPSGAGGGATGGGQRATDGDHRTRPPRAAM